MGKGAAGVDFLASLVYQGWFQLQRALSSSMKSGHPTSVLLPLVHSSTGSLLRTAQSQQWTNPSNQEQPEHSDIPSSFLLRAAHLQPQVSLLITY